MNNSNQNTTTEAVQVDTLTQDFVTAALIVSVATNLVVFVTWLTFSLSA